MSDDDLDALLARAEAGDTDARDQAIELAGERGDDAALARLAASGSRDAVDELVELAGERGDEAALQILAKDLGAGVDRTSAPCPQGCAPRSAVDTWPFGP